MSTPEIMAEIDRMAREGHPYKEIAEKVGMSKSNVTKILIRYRKLKPRKLVKVDGAP